MTLGYLKSTHVPGESYDQRHTRRKAFQAGMKAASFIIIPGGVSQPCDGILYRVGPENDNSNPGPGVGASHQKAEKLDSEHVG